MKTATLTDLKKLLILIRYKKQRMMNMTTQIKNSLISGIKNSNDLDFLKALQTIFDSSEQSLYQLSPEQNDSIQKGREDIKKGDYVENDQLMSAIKKWLAKE